MARDGAPPGASSSGGGRRTGSGRMLALAGLVALGWLVDARRRDRRLRTTHRILVDLLLNALTADDATTARHSRRVADLSYELACSLRMRGREVATLRVAALLHDLGKIDDRFWHLLHSGERLTPEQRAMMQQHPDESARILRPLESVHPGILTIVSSHHEHWDGGGYPDGLRGEGIPLAARVIALADVFDALTQPRSYRDPLPVEKVFAKLREGAGRQFDPRLVERVLDGALAARWTDIARGDLSEDGESAAPGRKAHAQPAGAQRDERLGARGAARHR
jgi:putative nucleotidyltransferase with HDIG domain